MKLLLKILPNVGPFIIIGGLLAAAFLIDPTPELPVIKDVPLAARDRYYGAAMPSADIIWLAGSGGKIVRSDDGGDSWRIQTTPTQEHLQDIDTWSAERAITVGNRGTVLVTEDGGVTWQAVVVPDFDVNHKLMNVIARPDGVAWVVGAMATVMVSRDYGQTWDIKAEQRDHLWNDMAIVDDDVAWVIGEYGQVLRTTDGGESWALTEGLFKNSMAAIAFHDPQNAIAVGVEGAVARTRDAGDTWTVVESGTPEHLYDVAWRGDEWVAAGDKGVFVLGTLSSDEAELIGPGVIDYLWHIELIPAGDQMLATGGTVGFLRDKTWHPLRSR